MADCCTLETYQNVVFERPISTEVYPLDQGKQGTEVFYARLLYTISDVVVFVTSSDQSLFKQMQKLLEWASYAVHKAFGAPAHKTLIVVRHMTKLHDKSFYKTSELWRTFIGKLGHLWEGSKQLQEFMAQCNEQDGLRDDQKILDNDALFQVFFKSVEVLYIPDRKQAPSSELFQQYRELRAKIIETSEKAQNMRAQAWMQWNVPTLSHILNRAFEHFRNEKEAFNFYDAARNDNPNPATMSDHIANFLRLVHDLPDSAVDMATDMVASGCLTWSFREFTQGMERNEVSHSLVSVLNLMLITSSS